MNLSKYKGVIVWDCEGKEYLDFMAGISSVN
jgi:4-aminobutyrate aminotransferase-like enzyme